MSFYSDIVDLILSDEIKSKQELHRTKVRFCREYDIDGVPPDSEILANVPKDLSDEEYKKVVSVLRRKPTRTISGVAVVAVMTSPAVCPHGRCIPCPGGPDWDTPQSYTGYEPAAMRADLNDFDPFRQVRNRLDQLKAIGHPVDKVDLIIMGGTFTARSPFYQRWFVKRCFDGLNNERSSCLEESQRLNESADSRCIGLTVETRPDWFRLQHVDRSLNLGATRVELGVQTTYDEFLYKMKRGHTVSDSIRATKTAKDAGLKVTYHMMPNLFGSSYAKDLNSFKQLFHDSRFKPDALKIYPTLVLKGTVLYQMWKEGEYDPYAFSEIVKLICEIKKIVPKWIRIKRVQRDIPSGHIVSGVKKSNLRQIVKEKMHDQGDRCRCIRCREAGHMNLKHGKKPKIEDIKLLVERYHASDGEELFLSFEDVKQDILIGFLRLRHPSENVYRSEINEKPSMIVRELHVYGPMNPLSKKIDYGWQHRGYGKKLLSEAEKIAREEFDAKKIIVISGIGVRRYYLKKNYKIDGPYVSKSLN